MRTKLANRNQRDPRAVFYYQPFQEFDKRYASKIRRRGTIYRRMEAPGRGIEEERCGPNRIILASQPAVGMDRASNAR